jgi:uncharacterized C2H2 Zn-finger protein
MDSTTTRRRSLFRRQSTYHAPSSPPDEDRDPVLNIPSLPKRSPTCPKTLEAIALGEQRMTDILGQFDLSSLSLSNNAEKDDDLPVPRGILHAGIGSNEQMAAPSLPSPAESPVKVQSVHQRHASDSGLGSSISTAGANEQGRLTMPSSYWLNARTHSLSVKAGFITTSREKAPHAQSAITQSVSTLDAPSSRRQLPAAACKQIERYILLPILHEERLKPFHPLVQSIPQRIANKEISCLRDLEKIILWLAPVSRSRMYETGVLQFAHSYFLGSKRFTFSKTAYIGFCEFTIQRIYTTVAHLNDFDQRLPSDPPYTNSYFLDLIAQIRQYAAMLAANRERAGTRSNKSGPAVYVKYSTILPNIQLTPIREERVTLEGGLSQTGRPAELVRHVDGQAISLRTGESYDDKTIPTMKRSLSNQSNDESVERSMARRKKNAPPMDINQKCRDCDKIFKRPCDLTKHEKTHSRPWKCSEPSCKYYQTGWPTEKERDRHVNDRHSSAPSLYKCKFSPCPYQSKRESNCKQHMEKAHGWVYVRSKNNGKHMQQTPSVSSNHMTTPNQLPTPPTPAMSTPISNSTLDFPTPASGPMPSPYDASSYDPSIYDASVHDPSPFDPFIGLNGNQPFSFADPPNMPNVDFQLFPDNVLDTIGLDDFNMPITEDFTQFQNQLEAGQPDEMMMPPSMDMDQFNTYCFDNEFYNFPGNNTMSGF